MPGIRPSGKVIGHLARRNFLTVTSMVRRSFLQGIEFELGMEHAEDYDLWRRVAARCPFEYVDEPLMRYRFHDGMTVNAGLGATLKGEIAVQSRFFDMPEFAEAPADQKARAYCAHGIKNAMFGATGVARTYFWRSIRTMPTYPGGYALLLVSLFGTRALQWAILKRRKLAGNQLGTTSGPMALTNKRKNNGQATGTSHAVAREELVAVPGGADA
jgi:hypothetical protein